MILTNVKRFSSELECESITKKKKHILNSSLDGLCLEHLHTSVFLSDRVLDSPSELSLFGPPEGACVAAKRKRASDERCCAGTNMPKVA